MDQKRRRHEKIRFRRSEIAGLESYPSAVDGDPPVRDARRPRSVGRRLARGVAVLLGLVVLVVVAIYGAGVAGVGSDRLAAEAQGAIQRLSNVEVETTLGGTRLVPDSRSLVALEVRDVHIARADTKETVLDAGLMRFGLNLRALRHGRLQLGSAKIVGARIAPADLKPSGEGRAWDAAITDANGLVDPSLVSTAVYKAIHRAFEVVLASGTRRVELADVRLIAAPDAPWSGFAISRLVVAASRARGISFDGDATLRGRRVTFSGEASRGPDTDVVDSLALTLSVPARNDVDGDKGGAPSGSGGLVRSMGALAVSITGGETARGVGNSLDLDVRMDDLQIGLEPSERLTFDGRLRAAIADDSKTLTIRRAQLSTGRSSFRFGGALGPVADKGGKAAPAYAFQFVSNRSNVAPEQSPEPLLSFKARVAGRYLPGEGRAIADIINVSTGTGNAVASASVTLAEGKSPGVTFAADVSRMATGQVKQLWPWFAASGARAWVLDHVFGGQVNDGTIQMSVPPGRLGNGVPLNDEEVSGHFAVNETRFDVAGGIPPVRDGDGEIRFAGTDIHVALSSGSVYMPSGRKVASSGGTFVLDDAQLTPRIGKLEIDVNGDAPAIVELASYDPINAARYIDLKPDDLSGDVTGHISADIPLQESIPADDLSWKVALDYTGMSVAKPFDGQKITDADGSIVIQPDRADITANAKLNGIPAKLDVVEPLGHSGVESKRDVALVLDDAAREKLLPGLSTILSGTATARFETLEDERQKVTIDLAKATLSLPWVGWEKGPGIPATASFLLENGEDTTTLSDFTLTGDPFGAKGTIRLAGGDLQSAQFTSASLNRGDDFALTINRSGAGYDVSLKGESVDARSVIKRFAPSTTGGGGASDSNVPITLDVDVETMRGFHDEALGNVDLSYRGSGADVGSLSVDAVTRSGRTVTLGDTTRDGRRSVRMESTDAGAVLRFLDIYEHMEGGSISLALAGPGGGALSGQIDARDFHIVNEPRLGSLVAAAPAEQRKSGQVDPGEVDAGRAKFDRGFAVIEKGEGYLKLTNGALRGPLIGTTFQGTLYDKQNNIAMTGTFMPAYGVNRIFGEIPIIGQILGNGRDRGLIGVTYRLIGKTSDPKLQVNPISAIAPGIFRQIFEFH